MHHFYFDTSALVKRYHPEKGSPVVDRIIEAKGRRGLITSYWTVLEFAIAFSWKRTRKEISDRALNVAVGNFLKELTELFTVRSVDDDLITAAIPCGFQHRLSSADALHLATAIELMRFSEEVGDKVIFVSADSKLCRAAKREGLEAINPRQADALKKVERLL
jgi:predicted nucleic acid-binding protein